MKRWMILVLLGLLVLGAVGVSAQDAASTSTITFNPVTFTFGPDIAQGVFSLQSAGTPPEAPASPGGPVPPGSYFTFSGTATAVGSYTMSNDNLYVFPVSGFAQYPADSQINNELAALQTLLADQPDLTGVTDLPYLPLATGGFAFIAQAQYLETDTLTGVRYLTSIRQDVGETLDGQVQYVFQGLTKDGQYVVSFRYFVLTGVLPTSPDPNLDYNAFAANYEQYISDIATQLNELDADSYTPSLNALDAFIGTITVVG
ncbi:MAG: hypothetical protein U0452_02590 [Anaerolineae bacterium]